MPDYDIKLWGRYTPTPGFRYKITYVKWLPAYDIEMDVPVVEYAEAGETVTFSFPDDYSYARFLPDYGFDIYQDANWNTVNYVNNTFTMPLGDVTVRGFYELTDPIVLVRVNGELKVVVPTEEEGAKTMAENNSIDLTPYVPTEAPAPGFEFYKWYKNVETADFFYYDSYWEPNRCIEISSPVPTSTCSKAAATPSRLCHPTTPCGSKSCSRRSDTGGDQPSPPLSLHSLNLKLFR